MKNNKFYLANWFFKKRLFFIFYFLLFFHPSVFAELFTAQKLIDVLTVNEKLVPYQKEQIIQEIQENYDLSQEMPLSGFLKTSYIESSGPSVVYNKSRLILDAHLIIGKLVKPVILPEFAFAELSNGGFSLNLFGFSPYKNLIFSFPKNMLIADLENLKTNRRFSVQLKSIIQLGLLGSFLSTYFSSTSNPRDKNDEVCLYTTLGVSGVASMFLSDELFRGYTYITNKGRMTISPGPSLFNRPSLKMIFNPLTFPKVHFHINPYYLNENK